MGTAGSDLRAAFLAGALASTPPAAVPGILVSAFARDGVSCRAAGLAPVFLADGGDAAVGRSADPAPSGSAGRADAPDPFI
jgi:hypothetical protein